MRTKKQTWFHELGINNARFPCRKLVIIIKIEFNWSFHISQNQIKCQLTPIGCRETGALAGRETLQFLPIAALSSIY